MRRNDDFPRYALRQLMTKDFWKSGWPPTFRGLTPRLMENVAYATVLGLLVVNHVWAQFRDAISLASAIDEVTWSSTPAWVNSGNCMRDTGVWLAFCSEGPINRISDRALAEDPGIPLVLGLFATFTGTTITVETVFRLFVMLNFVGIAIVSTLMIFLKAKVAAIFVLVFGPIVAHSAVSGIPHSGGLFHLALALSATLFTLLAIRNRARLPWFLSLILMAMFLAAMAILFRSAIGYLGLAVTFAVTLFSLRGGLRRETKTFLRTNKSQLLALISVPGSFLLAKLPIFLRDAFFFRGAGENTDSHGVWHSLFLGLGERENPWNIVWNDSYAIARASEVDPGIAYASNAYFDLMRDLYFQTILDDPLGALGVYLDKFLVLLLRGSDSFSILSSPMLLTIGLLVFVGLVVRKLAGTSSRFMLLATPLWLFFLGYLAQGTLFNTSGMYFWPAEMLLLTILGLVIDSLVSQRRGVRHQNSPNN